MAGTEGILDRVWNYDFPINDALQAYMWSHQTDPSCKQVSRQAKEVKFERVEELPGIIQPAFGKAITMNEDATMTTMGFDTAIHGDLPGADFNATMQFSGLGPQSTQANVIVTVAWKEGVADFVKQAIRIFITSRVSTWCDDLAGQLQKYKNAHKK